MAIKDVARGYRIDFRDQLGRRHRQTFRLRRDAERALRAAQDAVEKGNFIAPAQVPTFAEVAEQWFANKAGKRPSSLAYWRTHLDNHLIPALGALRLNRVSVDDIETLRGALRADPEKRLSEMTVNKILTTATAVFQFAERRGKCASNPAKLAERLTVSEEITDEEDGSVRRVSTRAVTEEDVLTPEEIRRLLQEARAGFTYTLLLTAAATGARHNELLALRWRDIDFEGGTVHIRRSLTWVATADEGRESRFYPPKTKAGRRKIPAPPALIQALRRWFLQSHYKDESDLIFPNADGKPRDHRAVNRRINRLRTRAKVRKFTMHSLRHTFASSLLQGGASIAEVQQYMGHKTPAVTLTVYTHFLRTGDSGAVAAHVAQLFPNGHVLDTQGAGAAQNATTDAVSA